MDKLRAAELLNRAANGMVTHGEAFKEACTMGARYLSFALDGSSMMSLRSCIPPQSRPDDFMHTCNVATYELGSLIHCLVYGNHDKARKDPVIRNSYYAEARIAHADLLTQVRLLAEHCGWDMSVQVADGEGRFRERMEELRKEII